MNYQQEKYSFYDFDELDYEDYLDYVNNGDYQRDYLEYCLSLESYE